MFQMVHTSFPLHYCNDDIFFPCNIHCLRENTVNLNEGKPIQLA